MSSYDHAGHQFFDADDPSYRVAGADAGWACITAFYDAHLRGRACRGHPGGRLKPASADPSTWRERASKFSRGPGRRADGRA